MNGSQINEVSDPNSPSKTSKTSKTPTEKMDLLSSEDSDVRQMKGRSLTNLIVSPMSVSCMPCSVFLCCL